jgi:hypothetical protein
MEQNEPINVNIEHEKFLTDLQKKVDAAFLKRKLNTKEEMNAEDEYDRKRLQGDPEEILDLGDFNGPPRHEYQAWVDNPHDYPELIRMASRKALFYREKGFMGWMHRILKTKNIILQDLEHEAQHYIPGIGTEGLKFKYAVEFSQEMGLPSMRAKIILAGKIRRGLLKEMIGNPTRLSESDRAKIGINIKH